VAEQPAPEGAPAAGNPLVTWARPFGWLGALAIVYMTLATTLSVLGRHLAGWEPQGMQEQMELALAVAVFCALPGAFLRDDHVTIDLVDGLGRRRLTALLRIVGLLLGLVLLALAFWRSIDTLRYKWDSPEVTGMLSLPKYLYALPVAFGAGLSLVAIAAVLWAVITGRLHGGAKRHLD